MSSFSHLASAVGRAAGVWLSLPLISFLTLTIVRLFQSNDIFSGAIVDVLQHQYDGQVGVGNDLVNEWSRWALLSLTTKWIIAIYALVALVFLVTEALLRLTKDDIANTQGSRRDSYARVRPLRLLVLALIGLLLMTPMLLWISESSCFHQPSLNFACGGTLSMLLASLVLASWIIFIARALILHQVDKAQSDR
jgi:hypothetical protein